MWAVIEHNPKRPEVIAVGRSSESARRAAQSRFYSGDGPRIERHASPDLEAVTGWAVVPCTQAFAWLWSSACDLEVIALHQVGSRLCTEKEREHEGEGQLSLFEV